MRFIAASAFALATLIGVGGASACEEWLAAYTTQQPAAQVATAAVKQMVATYLEELTEEHRIA